MDGIEIIFRKYKDKIFTLAYRMTGDKDAARDIMQDTFMQALKSLDQFKGESQIYTWVYKIAKNNCLRFLEKKNKTAFLSLQELIDNNSSPVAEEISATEKMNYIAQVKDGCLSGLLRCLSLQQRLAFILNVLLDLPTEQVARVIDKSENATRILVHRSKKNIRVFLCKNCSLYNSENDCHCVNLVNFSLSKGWIDLNNTAQIESEIMVLKDVVGLYKTLHETSPTNEFDNQIQRILSAKEDFLILNDKKVK